MPAVRRITAVTQASVFEYYGAVSRSIVTEGSDFLAAVTEGDEQAMAATIETFLVATYDDCVGEEDEKNACWFTVRVTRPSGEFAVPRWHQDGRMFPCDERREDVVRSKYALAMLGPATLMLHPHAHVFSTLQEGEKKHFWWWETGEADGRPEPTEEEEVEASCSLRQWLAEKLTDADRIPVPHDRVVRFSWGREDSPVHSEPDLTSDRVFMSILYGSEAELRRMCEWRDAEYRKFDDGAVSRALSLKQTPGPQSVEP